MTYAIETELIAFCFTNEQFKKLKYSTTTFRNCMFDALEVNKSRFKNVIFQKVF